MMLRRWEWPAVLAALILVAGVAPAHAQFQTEKITLTADERQRLTQGCERLRQEIEALRTRSRNTGKPAAELLPDVEIFLYGVERNLQQDLFFSKASVNQAMACLKEGETRVADLRVGNSPWREQTGVVLLGYRSQVDGSVQPYQVYIPKDHDFSSHKPGRLDIFLHGRGDNYNELAFLTSKGWVKGNFGTETPKDLALYPYGRGNNGWRYAGERDVFEALGDCKRRYRVDNDQVTLRGFSMGGHGVWHIGLQHPGVWAAMSPGAGFVETKRYHNLTQPFNEWQNALLHLYDPLDYALNARNLPVLPYVGELDSFYSQHQIMYAALKQEEAPFQDFLGVKTPHRYEPSTLQSLLAAIAPAHRAFDAESVDFVTYTLRFAECKWVRIEGLEQHWQRAEVRAHRGPQYVEIKTRNVTALHLNLPGWKGDVIIDGQKLNWKSQDNATDVPGKPVANRFGIDDEALRELKVREKPVSLVKAKGRWAFGESTGVRKKPGSTGPMDDALFGPVLAVSGTGTPWNESAGRWTTQELQRFRNAWGRYFRATLPETTDTALTKADINHHHLYLFGDPGSNAVLRRILPRLPLRWTKDTVTFAGKTFSARDHLPLLVFPNPDNPECYIVLNMGVTFSNADMEGSNSMQYPHLPDYAVLRFDPDHFSDDRGADVVLAGFFDENWRIPRPR